MWAIGDLNRRARRAVVKEFRGPVWVTGELTRLVERRGTRWLELVERGGGRDGRDAHLQGLCSAAGWERISTRLAQADVAIRVGQRLVVSGTLDVGDRGELTLWLQDVDVAALVGERLLARRALLRRLAEEDLLEANRRLALPPFPLRVGLVMSGGSDGHRDVLRQLDSSDYAFVVTLRAVTVEGPKSPRAIGAALATFGPDDVDVAVVVRGGGTKASLDVFDSETVARAVASAAVPVWTGIGHAVDATVADEVAHRCCATPTAVGQALVGAVAGAWRRVAEAGACISRLVESQTAGAAADLRACRRHVSSVVRSQLTVHRDLHAATSAAVRRAAAASLDAHTGELAGIAGAIRSRDIVDGFSAVVDASARRVRTSVERQLDAAGDRMGSRRQVLDAYDPRRQLARGWTLTRSVEGRLVRRAGELTEGDTVVTTFLDGTARSTVTRVAPDDDGGAAP